MVMHVGSGGRRHGRPVLRARPAVSTHGCVMTAAPLANDWWGAFFSVAVLNIRMRIQFQFVDKVVGNVLHARLKSEERQVREERIYNGGACRKKMTIVTVWDVSPFWYLCNESFLVFSF